MHHARGISCAPPLPPPDPASSPNIGLTSSFTRETPVCMQGAREAHTPACILPTWARLRHTQPLPGGHARSAERRGTRVRCYSNRAPPLRLMPHLRAGFGAGARPPPTTGPQRSAGDDVVRGIGRPATACAPQTHTSRCQRGPASPAGALPWPWGHCCYTVHEWQPPAGRDAGMGAGTWARGCDPG